MIKYFEPQQVQFKILSLEKIQLIHSAAINILEQTGVLVDNKEALTLLKNAGADIEDGSSRVRIPSYLIDEVLTSAPKNIAIGNRDGDFLLNLDGNNSIWGQKVDCLKYSDPYTGKIRDIKKEDTINAILVADYLPNIDYLHFSDLMPCNNKYASKETFKEVIKRTKKPVHIATIDAEEAKQIIDIAAVVRGGNDKLAHNPFVMCYNEPITPLKHPDDAVKKLLLCAERGIPIWHSSMLSGGATAPSTPAGMLALAVAEILSGLVIHQLKRKGAPFIFGGMPTTMDMQTTIYPYGSPELHLMCAALTEIAHFYGFPMFGTAGVSDSMLPDEQSAIEVTLSCLTTMLSGANVIHDIGLIGSASILSLEVSVMTSELVEMINHIMKGIEVNEETLALDIINKNGPSGHFLYEEHTAKHFKEYFYPELLNRKKYDDWVKEGQKTYRDKLRQKVVEIIENHRPNNALPDDLLLKIGKM